ncbi:hypothetical protein LTR37_013029 [Vermiconidia calcicola]|uniref:Uncharacterized protein n=1 Tax=Vermiconidia calcicola TaxID=1690605 RepID=A0ACC3MXR9_9PEZI|nr:hypothetical protein LTR37_013029 [Vermiconidia calcicola]
MDPNSTQALRVALAHIDGHRGEFTSPREQNDMLSSLIKKHDLKHRKKGSSQTTVLQVAEYRTSLGNFAHRYGAAMDATVPKMTQVMTKGSKATNKKGQQKVGYLPHSKVADSEGSGDLGPAEATTPRTKKRDKSPSASYSPSNSDAEPDRVAVSKKQQQNVKQTHPTAAPNASKQPSSSRIPSVSGEEVLAKPIGTSQKRKSVEEHDAQPSKKLRGSSAANASGSSYQRTVPDSEAEQDSITVSSPQEQSQPQTHTSMIGKAPEPPSFSPITVSDGDSVVEALPSNRKRKIATGLDDSAVKKPKPSFEVHATQPEASKSRTPGDSSAQGTKPSARVIKLGPDTIVKDMNSIWGSIQTLSSRFINGTDADGDGPAVWSLDPGKDLEKLYFLLFGEDWEEATSILTQASMMNAMDVVEACMVAAVYEWVLTKEVPWDGPEQIVKNSPIAESFYNQVLRESGAGLPWTDQVWQAARMQVVDNAFRERVIVPAGKALARRFMHMFGPQLTLLGIEKTDETAEDWWRRRMTDVSVVFTKALALKGLMQASPGAFLFTWIEHGKGVHDAVMEDLYDKTGRREVAWCVAPVIRTRASPENEPQLVCRAKVMTKLAKSK